MDTKKLGLTALSVILAGGMIVSAFMIWQQLHGRRQDAEGFEELRVVALSPQTTAAPIVAPVAKAEKEPVHKRDIGALIEQNKDTAGWIYIPSTAVDYPVMHTPEEPQKYLHLSFEGRESFSGVPFMDARCSFTDDNLIIYGHRMKSGSMFAAIVDYKDKAFLLEHPVIEWETITGCEEYNVCAVAMIDKGDKWYSFTDAATRTDFEQMMDYLYSISLYDTGIRPTYSQQLITLSTCYGDSDDDRLIVVAVKMN